MATTEINTETNYLVVPIDVEAMCVGNESDSDNTFTTDPYQFDLLKKKEVIPLSKHIHKATTASMGKGIYVHWALTDGLTHAIENKGELEFPIVPNRWLVSRLIDGKELKHWVVESDYLSEENNEKAESKQAIPYKLDKREAAIKYLGRVLSINDWENIKNQNADNAYPKLTATGYGIPEFAASYQHSKGVFSFYDADIKDKKGDVNVSYFVVGWYENYEETHPILRTETKDEKITAILEHYKWCLPKDTNIENTNINEIYCSGSISGINWNANKKYLNDLHYPEISLAIGHNENEALSALITGLSEGDQHSEQLLNALQLGMLEDVIQPNSINNLQNVSSKLNDATFQSKEGGTFWQIEPETISNSENADNWKLDPLLKDETLSKDLNDLNELQRQNDDLQQQLIDRKKQLYLYWTASLTPNTSYQTELRLYLKEQVEALPKKKIEIQNLNNKIKNKKTEIENKLKNSVNKNYIFVLKQYPSVRYYKPLEPVILFQGAKINTPKRYGSDGEYTANSTLVCRLNNQLISKVKIEKTDIYGDILLEEFKAVPKEIIADLLLTNPNYLNNKDNSFSIDNYKKIINDFVSPKSDQLKVTSATPLLEVINKVQNSKELYYSAVSAIGRNIDGIQFDNISPSPVGINFWENNPWLPLYFSYDVSYYPMLSKNENSYDPNFITTNFKLEHESDKLLVTDYNSFSQNGIHYQNTCLLSQHSKVNLQEKIEEYIRKHPEQGELGENLKQFLAQSQQLPDLLSQSIFGLNYALLGLKNTLQLPVLNYDENEKLQNLANDVHEQTDGSNSIELDGVDDSAHYYPLSAGLLKINSLTIVDAFGRNIDVPKNKLFSASSLKSGDNAITNVYLAPRLASPAKLTANWLDDKNTPTNGLLASNPIAGWLMPNFINKSIWLFTKDGASAGELTENGTWKKTPGCIFENFNAVKNSNPELVQVFTYLQGNENLTKFLTNVKTNLVNNQPENHRSLNNQALFFGVPLAIATINLSIEIEGLPPINYNKDSIASEIKDNNIDVFISDNKFKRCNGLDKVNLPVLVGNNNHLGDGLMAYCTTSDYTTFYYKNEEQTLTPNGNPLKLCVILDPRNNIHIHTGILPVKVMRMPQHYYTNTLQDMQLAIDVPKLVVAAQLEELTIKMPLPSAENNNWEWWFEEDSKWESKPAQEEHDDTVNEGFNELTKGWLKITNKK